MFSRIHTKRLAAVLLVIFVQSLIMPSVSMALTSGPTAPEFSSFEPVDTTDMVNLITGDMTYNTPIVEVPGPEGGYPLSLSYHAGIKPEEEASWVGLGWTLNPGAITRTVNGYADDLYKAERGTYNYWPGGREHTFSVGYGVAWGMGSAGLELSVSHDTYQGFSGVAGVNAGIHVGVAQASLGISTQGVSASGGVGAFGANAGVGVASSWAGDVSAWGSASVSASFYSGYQRSGSTSMGSIGVTLGSSGLNPRATLLSQNIDFHNSANSLSSAKIGINIPIPTQIGIFTVGYSYRRYWLDQYDSYNAVGLINFPYITDDEYKTEWLGVINGNDPLANTNYANFRNAFANNNVLDSYALLDPNNLSADNDPERSLGGSFAAPDGYSVTGQGISGSIQPYVFETGSLYRQTRLINPKKSDKLHANTYYLRDRGWTKRIEFRFINDLSNAMAPGELEDNILNLDSDPSNETDDGCFVNQYRDGAAGAYENSFPSNYVPNPSHPNSTLQNAEGRRTTGTNTLTSSKHIEYFFNNELSNSAYYTTSNNYNPDVYSQGNIPSAKTRGFMDYHEYGPRNGGAESSRKMILNSKDISHQIGGFSITKEDGTTYHYALPVYAYKERSYSTLVDKKGGDRTSNTYNDHPYAYTWLLTAVTGPDFIDNNNNGIVDNGDYGYWVRFSYGKWSDGYAWRSPFWGNNTDINSNYEVNASGQKEIYYLDAVSTRTHTALFIKDLRSDGLGFPTTTTFKIQGPFSSHTIVNHPFQNNIFAKPYSASFINTNTLKLIYRKNYENAQLFLKEISIIPNNKLGDLATIRGGTPYTYTAEELTFAQGFYQCTTSDIPVIYNCSTGNLYGYTKSSYQNPGTFFDNIINSEDFLPSVSNNFVESKKFSYENLLAPNTINTCSDIKGDLRGAKALTGKLTLKSVLHVGKNATSIIPGTYFQYDFPQDNVQRSMNIIQESVKLENGISRFAISDLSTSLKNGDIVEFWINKNGVSNKIYGQISSYDNISPNKFWISVYPYKSNYNSLEYIYEVLPSQIGNNIKYRITKNPPYIEKSSDWWGCFKADFAHDNRVYAPSATQTTDLSSQNSDVWSLRTIETPMGASIDLEYETDTYSAITHSSPVVFNIDADLTELANANSLTPTVIFREKDLLSEYLKVNSTIDIKLTSLKFVRLCADCKDSDLDCAKAKIENETDPCNLDFCGSYSNYEFSTEEVTLTGQISSLNTSTGAVQLTNASSYLNDISSTNTAKNSHLVALMAGYLTAPRKKTTVGGGIRVKSVAITDNSGVYNKTHYDYMNSGITSFEPVIYDRVVAPAVPANDFVSGNHSTGSNFRSLSFGKNISNGFCKTKNMQKLQEYMQKLSGNYLQRAYSSFDKFLSIARELPLAGVYYSKVRVSESYAGSHNNLKQGILEYEFTVPSREMVQFVYTDIEPQSGSSPKKFNYIHPQIEHDNSNNNSPLWNTGGKGFTNSANFFYRKVQLHDFTSAIGSLKSMTVYDNANRIVNQSKYYYLHDLVNNTNSSDYISNYISKMNFYNLNYLGRIEQSFYEFRILTKNEIVSAGTNIYVGDNFQYDIESFNTNSKKIDYPCVLLRVVTMANGITSETENLKFDNFTGAPTKVKTTDGYGNVFITEGTPAYQVKSGTTTIFPRMGLKTTSYGNKHMLTQPGESYTYKAKTDLTPDYYLSGGVTTWNDDWTYRDWTPGGFTQSLVQDEVIRQYQTYAWNGPADANGGLLNFTLFNWGTWNANTSLKTIGNWYKASEVTRYDRYSHPLEEEDMNGNCASVRMDNDNAEIIASASMARQAQMAYSGGEEQPLSGYKNGQITNYLSEVNIHTSSLVTTYAHTGKKSLKVNPGQKGFTFSINVSAANKTAGRNYRASVWVHGTNLSGATLFASPKLPSSGGYLISPVQVKGSGYGKVANVLKAGNWYQLFIDLPYASLPDGEEITVEALCDQLSPGSVYFDDFRVHPIESSMSSFVYDDATGELMAILDNDNLATRFTYDAMGKLIKTERERPDQGNVAPGFRTVAEGQYNYGNYLKADFSADKSTSASGEAVTFTAATQVTQYPINATQSVKYEWDFGDGTAPVIAYNANPISHTYTNYGAYNVTLKVSDGAYAFKNTYQAITKVHSVLPPPLVVVPDASVSLHNGQASFRCFCDGQTWTMPGTETFSVTASGGIAPLTRTWNWTGPTTMTIDPSDPWKVSIPVPGTNDGTHTLTCTVSDGAGQQISAVFILQVDDCFTTSPDPCDDMPE